MLLLMKTQPSVQTSGAIQSVSLIVHWWARCTIRREWTTRENVYNNKSSESALPRALTMHMFVSIRTCMHKLKPPNHACTKVGSIDTCTRPAPLHSEYTRSALELHLSRESAQGAHSTCTSPERVLMEHTRSAPLHSDCARSALHLHLSRASVQGAHSTCTPPERVLKERT